MVACAIPDLGFKPAKKMDQSPLFDTQISLKDY